MHAPRSRVKVAPQPTFCAIRPMTQFARMNVPKK